MIDINLSKGWTWVNKMNFDIEALYNNSPHISSWLCL